MNKKRLLAILTAVLVLLIAMVVVLNSCQRGDSEPTPTTATTEATTDATISSTEAATEPEETTAPTEAPTEPEETENPGETEHEHDYKSEVTAPTCTEMGYTTYTCSCGDTYKDNETKATGHDYKSTVIAPTKTAQGYTLYECKNCDYSYKDNYTDKLPSDDETEPVHQHSYNSKVTAPTCTAKGYTTYTCECGDSYKGNETPALGHDWDNGKVTKKATCTEDGVKTYTCERSGCGKTKTEAIAKTGHKYETTTVAPTTEAKGYDLHTCKNCGDSYKDNYTDKLPDETEPPHQHSYTSKITKAATCTEDGVKTFTCSCGDSYTETIDATGHSYSSKVTAPTCENGGYTTHTCGNCGHSYKDSITTALGHSYKTETIAPTTEAEGYDLHTCGNCGHQYKDNYTDKLPEETEPDEPTVDDYLANSHYSDEAITYINEYRAANGLPALRVDHSDFVLLRAAELRVSFSHTRPNGGYIYEDGWASECIAGGYSSAKSVVDAWYNSTGGHKETMLNASYTVACVAYNGSYWVLLVA